VFEDNEITTKTDGDPGKKSAMYCALEVAAHEQRGRKSDVFSLGCVFIELLTVLCGKSLQEFTEWRGPEGARAYHLNQDRTLRWLFHLQPRAWGYHHYCCAALIPSLSLRISATDLSHWISCGRDYLRGWHCDRACSCLGHEPVGMFCAISLDCNPPYESAFGTVQPISWAVAYELWITKTYWNQTDRKALPTLIRRESPTRVQHSSITPRNFLEELDNYLASSGSHDGSAMDFD
jgi:serine/threonine protein kinase